VPEAGYPDAEYVAKGGKVLRDRAEVFRAADITHASSLLRLQRSHRQKTISPSFIAIQVLVGFLRPLGSVETITEIASKGVTSFLRRTDDAHHARAKHGCALLHGHHLGYKAVLIAADSLQKIFPMMTPLPAPSLPHEY